MYQIAVDAPVAIHEGMNEDETECDYSRQYDRVEPRLKFTITIVINITGEPVSRCSARVRSPAINSGTSSGLVE